MRVLSAQVGERKGEGRKPLKRDVAAQVRNRERALVSCPAGNKGSEYGAEMTGVSLRKNIRQDVAMYGIKR